MHPVGNDIVDLYAEGADGRAGDSRFVERVLAPFEISVLERSLHPDRMLWAFWAAKEAAYKAVGKTVPEITSAPRRYRVMFDRYGSAPTAGVVETPCGAVPIRVFCRDEFVHCIASAYGSDDFSGIVYGSGKIPAGEACESTAVRQKAAADIAVQLAIDPERIRILRNPAVRGLGPPEVYIDGAKAPVDISLSHDGRFVAWAFCPGSQVTAISK